MTVYMLIDIILYRVCECVHTSARECVYVCMCMSMLVRNLIYDSHFIP